ncbi:putative F-box/LRR-repeat protein At5g02700 [Lycium barbarum]|uniref:putative F-box/LRR-repeat protein At5g02700 n=1 Tax=Lycium barbarum TaxID=112863 RepID=UPI00293F5B6D|nr:putative F-box/LRR-repeat protein At5g02700 [Lycium barbarum]
MRKANGRKKKNCTTITLDVLPDCLIYKILSYLPFKEAAQMSILSKTWLQAWLIHPNLEFTLPYLKVVDSFMERYRDGKIPIEKFELSDSAGSSQGFPSIDKWIDIALQNGVKYLVFKVASISLPIFTILAAKSLRELVLEGCTLNMPVSLTSGIANCDSLRKLSLSCVSLDEHMLQTLLSSCPLIVNFILKDCDGLEKIELLNLQKIKSVFISTQRNLPVKIRAPTLEHLSYSGYLSDELDVVECQNLIFLDVSYVLTSDGFLQHLISRFQSLKVLKIQYCGDNLEIDSPNLVSFEYVRDQIPEHKIVIESRKLKHSKIVLHCYDYLNDAWFCKLRKFLSNSTSWSQVSLYFPKCNEINMKDLQLHHRVATPQVDILNVNILWQNAQCPTFVDALLWSCHPRRLNLHSSIKMITCFICRLMYMKNSSQSFSQRSKPWHSHQLMEIKVFDGKNQPLQLRNGELAISTLTDWKEVSFLLDWQCS